MKKKEKKKKNFFFRLRRDAKEKFEKIWRKKFSYTNFPPINDP